MSDPEKSYVTVKQGSQESFVAFLDRLQDAMEKQIADVNVKETLILQLA